MPDIVSMDRTHVEVTSLAMQGTDDVVPKMTPAERIALVWPLTLDAWSFKEPSIADPDFKDMLLALTEADADYLVVGAYAVAAHGYPRATGDLDLWVRPTSDNADKDWNDLVVFGAPASKLKVEDFFTPDVVYQIGVAPRRIDILTSISGVEFDVAWKHRLTVSLDGLALPVIGRKELLQNKRASGRPKDIADVHTLDSGEK